MRPTHSRSASKGLARRHRPEAAEPGDAHRVSATGPVFLPRNYQVQTATSAVQALGPAARAVPPGPRRSPGTRAERSPYADLGSCQLDWTDARWDRGAGAGVRTLMPLRAAEFKSAAYTDSATPAGP